MYAISIILVLSLIILAFIHVFKHSASKASLENIARLYKQDRESILQNPKKHWLCNTIEESQKRELEIIEYSQQLFNNRNKK